MDTVVTRYRGREIDEKDVAVEIYDAGNARQRDGDAKLTARWQDPPIATKKMLTSVPWQKT
jgi:hypothetical protein